MKFSALFFIGLFAACSTALGYYYYYVYSPPLIAAERFMRAMENRDAKALAESIIISQGANETKLRPPEDAELRALLVEGFERGRILDQRKREDETRVYHYLVYREPDGRVYALLVTEEAGRFLVVVPEHKTADHRQYLWDYEWRN